MGDSDGAARCIRCSEPLACKHCGREVRRIAAARPTPSQPAQPESPPLRPPEEIAAEIVGLASRRFADAAHWGDGWGDAVLAVKDAVTAALQAERERAEADRKKLLDELAKAQEAEAEAYAAYQSRCQNHRAVKAQLCQECLDHAAETGAYL